MATLLLHWHVTNELNKFQKLHLYYFEKYAKIFDMIIISLSIDDTDNYKLIEKTKNYFTILTDKNIDFQIIKNDPINRESETFINNILNNNDINDLTFFAHSKKSDYGNDLSVLYWIASMWFFNLENYKDFTDKIIKGKFVSSGILKTYIDNWKGQKYGWHYSGAFYWFDPNKIRSYNPPKEKNRFYVESLFGRLFDSNLALESNYFDHPEKDKIHDLNAYLTLPKKLKYMFEPRLYEKFESELKEFLKNVSK